MSQSDTRLFLDNILKLMIKACKKKVIEGVKNMKITCRTQF
jgi:hypothetical protein